MSMIIKSMIVNPTKTDTKEGVKNNFQWLWFTTVTDVDLKEHCRKCLIGNDVSFNTESCNNIELKNCVHYLCGVRYNSAWQYSEWEKNFHLAFRPCEGKTLECDENGIKIVIENAERLPISPEFIDWSLVTEENKKNPRYWTCRNLHFAHWFYKDCTFKKMSKIRKLV